MRLATAMASSASDFELYPADTHPHPHSPAPSWWSSSGRVEGREGPSWGVPKLPRCHSTPQLMILTARLDGGRRGVDTAVVGWWYYWWGCEVLLVDPPPPPQFGHCWSNLTVVSGIYLPIVRVVWMGPLTDPKFMVSTTSTHQNLSKPPPPPPPSPHTHPPRVRCFGHSTRFLTPYRPTNS